MASPSLPRLAAEGLGTLLLVYLLAFAAGGGIVSAAGYALALALLYWVFASVSGAHLNPFVSLAFAVRGRLGWVDAAAYVLVQLVGGLLGALLLWAAAGSDVTGAALGASAEVTGDNLWKALVALAIGAFLLVTAYLALSDGGGLLLAGLGVGAAFGLAALTGAGGVNLAQIVGADLTFTLSGGSAEWGSIWVYIVGPLVGALAAAYAYGPVVSVRGIQGSG